MPFLDPPGYAAWQHVEARNGFEVVFLSSGLGGYRMEGTTAAVEANSAWHGLTLALRPKAIALCQARRA